MLLADSDRLDTLPLPAVVAVACVGWLIVRNRKAVIQWWTATTGASVGPILGSAFVVLGGYGWLLIGTLGSVVWFIDALA